jgi:hypothetical protein
MKFSMKPHNSTHMQLNQRLKDQLRSVNPGEMSRFRIQEDQPPQMEWVYLLVLLLAISLEAGLALFVF